MAAMSRFESYLKVIEQWCLSSPAEAVDPCQGANADSVDDAIANVTVLNAAIEAHEQFLNTEGREGQRLDLSSRTICRNILEGGQWKGRNLSSADFGTNQMGAVDFAGSDLSDANLANVPILEATQFAGAKLRRCKLTETFVFPQVLVADEMSKNCGKYFITVLTACAFTCLTVLSTNDAALISGSASTPLPILQTPMSLIYFYKISPVILLVFFVFQLINMQYLWETVAGLPSIFSDNRDISQTTYPWVVNQMASYYSPWKSGSAKLQRLADSICQAITVMAMYSCVPLTIGALWIRSIRRHDTVLTYGLCVYITVAVSLSMLAYSSARHTLSHQGILINPRDKKVINAQPRRKFAFWPVWRLYAKSQGINFALNVIAICVLSIALDFIMYFTIPTFQQSISAEKCLVIAIGICIVLLCGYIVSESWIKEKLSKIKEPLLRLSVGPVIISCAVYVAFVLESKVIANGKTGISIIDIESADVSQRPNNWAGSNKEQYEAVTGANLRGLDLKLMHGERAFLVHADMRGCDLTEADLSHADLRSAYMQQPTDLETVRTHTVLTRANLSAARLDYADMEYASCEEIKLPSANLSHANLSGATFRDKAILNDAIITDAQLEYCKLQGTSLLSADLERADLKFANLDGARLERADLRGAIINSRTTFAGAYYSNKSHFPDGFDKKAAGMIFDPHE